MNKENMSIDSRGNYLTSVAFEVRFHPLLIIQSVMPEFQKRIRTRFPILERGISFEIGPQASGFPPEFTEWAFASKDQSTRVRASIGRLSIVTKDYGSFKPFLEEIHRMIKAFSETTSIDSYNRVGLRYVNEIPLKEGRNPIEEILDNFNPVFDKNRMHEDRPFKFDSEYRTLHENNVRVTCRNKFFEPVHGQHLYFIDIDSYTEDVTLHSDLKNVIPNLHEQVLKEFRRNVTEGFLEYIGGG